MAARIIAVVPIGRVTVEDVAPLTSNVARAFSTEVVVAPAMALPTKARDSTRGQYLARAIIKMLAHRKRSEWSRLLGVASEDLYAPGLNFVFGEADAERGVAVFSLARLGQIKNSKAAVSDAPFHRRMATEAIHELSHTYGLGHCSDPHCVMWFSNTLAETDRKGTEFCPAHHVQLTTRL
jgi:archaemetzincin